MEYQLFAQSLYVIRNQCVFEYNLEFRRVDDFGDLVRLHDAQLESAFYFYFAE